MGPQREADASENPPASEDSIESLLRSTDKDTEEIVEALRDSGPRRHVSETSVDDVLTELSRPQAGESDDQFALSGGPTRTVSTSGIDEVFEALEAEAPSLPSESGAGASTRSACGESAVNGSGSASSAVAANSAGGPAASDEGPGPTIDAPDRADDPVPAADEDAEAFGSLVGGEPTRSVSDESVDDILAGLEDGSPDPDAGTPSPGSGEAADDLRPDDPEGELVDLLAGDEPPSGARAEPPATESAGVETADGPTRVADAAERLGECRSDRSEDADPGGDSSTETSAADAFEWVDPGTDAPASESPSSPADDQPTDDADAVTGGASRPLVTRAELEEIAALVSEPSADEPAPDPTVGQESSAAPESDGPVEREAAAGDRSADDGAGALGTRADSAPSAPTVGTPRDAVTVDAVIAPTDASLGGRPPSDANGVDPGPDEDRRAASGSDHDRPADPDGAAGDSGESRSIVRRFGSIVRRLTARLRR